MFKTKEYALYKLRNMLHFMETQEPILYNAIDKNGKIKFSFFYEKWINDYEKEGFRIVEADLKERIKKLNKIIDYYNKV